MAERAARAEVGGNSLPRAIHGYSLIEQLGRGSFATAYRAEKDGRVYCLREMDTRRIDPRRLDEAAKLFIRENQVLAGLDHPFIPKVHDIFDETQDGALLLYQVQDLVPGACLKSLMYPEQSFAERVNGGKLVRPFAEEQVVDIGLKLSGILAYLHNQAIPVVHRDVKPSNIMLNPPDLKKVGDVYLIDFGAVQQALITMEGGSTMFGTPGYAPPELLTGNAVPKSDIYMLGRTLLALASGIEPSEISDYLGRVNYKDQFKFKNPSLEAVVDHMIQLDPENRPESAEQVADYLEKIKTGKRISRVKDGAGKGWAYLSRLVPDGLLKHLVRTKQNVVDEARREAQVLVADETVNDEVEWTVELGPEEAKIEKTDNYWTFHNVPLIGQGNEQAVLRMTRGLLFDGANLRQEEYVQRLQAQGEGLVLPTAPEYLSLCVYLGQFNDHPIPEQKRLFKEATAWLEKLFKDYWLMTGTRAVYHPDGQGTVIQGVGRDSPFRVSIPYLVGPDGWVKEKNDVDALEALCGTRDQTQVNNSFKAISGHDSYLWRLNNNPPQDTERAVVLGVNYKVRFGIVAINSLFNGRRALGVVTSRAKKMREATE